MCLILLAHQAHESYRLIVAANRDEFYERPTARAAFWRDAPGVLGGRDLRQGGTWLGVTRGGRFAAVTNFRDASAKKSGAPSRGFLVSDFLRGEETPAAYLERLAAEGARYEGFNLVAGVPGELHYYSNRDGRPRALAPGVYGVSNHLLDTPWPKVERGKRALAETVGRGGRVSTGELFRLLADDARAADDRLPETGVGLELERVLSPLFIRSAAYGTRSSTVLLAGSDGEVTFAERAFGPGGESGGEDRHRFELEKV